jgi:murein DD-endopeptidase MepM/ murein hydrolase activator NlpD
VQAGDTLSGISLQYNVSLDDLYKLNNLTRDSVLIVGQQIVVKAGQGATVAPTATTAPQATPTQTQPPTPTLAPTLPPSPLSTDTPVPGGLCMSAFDDANGNTVRDGNEASLAGVSFVVSSSGSEVARYVTQALPEPYCLTTLPPGAYSVQVNLLPGYVASFERADVALALGQRVDLAVAAHRGEPATATSAPTVEAQATQIPSPARNNSALIAALAFGGIFLALIAIAVVIIRRG